MEEAIDQERSRETYSALLESFLSSPFFGCDPINFADNEIDAFINRKHGPIDNSWLSLATLFCSKCHLEDIYDVQSGNLSYYEIRIVPYNLLNQFITLNRFRYQCFPVFESRHIAEGNFPKTYEVFGANRPSYTLDYFRKLKGQDLIYCYKFWSVDDFGKQRWCLRLSEKEYVREAILLSQRFTIDYLLSHPLDCFPDPWAAERLYMLVDDNLSKWRILAPIIESNRKIIDHKLNQVNEYIRKLKLSPEVI